MANAYGNDTGDATALAVRLRTADSWCHITVACRAIADVLKLLFNASRVPQCFSFNWEDCDCPSTFRSAIVD